jgi:hypothetical protein
MALRVRALALGASTKLLAVAVAAAVALLLGLHPCLRWQQRHNASCPGSGSLSLWALCEGS